MPTLWNAGRPVAAEYILLQKHRSLQKHQLGNCVILAALLKNVIRGWQIGGTHAATVVGVAEGNLSHGSFRLRGLRRSVRSGRRPTAAQTCALQVNGSSQVLLTSQVSLTLQLSQAAAQIGNDLALLPGLGCIRKCKA